MIRRLRVSTPTNAFLGAPAKPMGKDLRDAIALTVSHIPAVIEAHLPQFYAPGLTEAPSQVLVVVIEFEAALEEVLQEIERGLAKILPTRMDLDVWSSLKDDPVLNYVRSAGCNITKGRIRK